MNDPVISVEGLSKQYLIRHQADTHHRYVTLRDVLAEKARQMLRPGAAAGAETQEQFWALQDVSFTVRQGECVGIIGRNGAGKSTLLKLLSRITEPTRGRIRLRGRVASLLEVGTGFHPELTGRENIFLNGAILGMTRTEITRKFDEIVAFAEVEKFLDTPVKRYSSGMYMRLAFSVAAHLEPEILIVDEVLAVGDAKFQLKCLDKMEDVGKAGRTVLFVSHNMPAVTRLCRQGLLLVDGRLARTGTTTEVVQHYLSAGLSQAAERQWPAERAPEHPCARLRAVRLFDDQTGELADTVDIRHPVRLEIEYENRPSDRHVYANIQLFDANNICLFASGDFNNREWRHQPRQFHGVVTSSCLIPGNFLAEGQFRVLVGLTTHNPNEVLVLERDAVSFVVVDHSEGDGVRGEFAGPYPGALRPSLEWRIARHDLPPSP